MKAGLYARVSTTDKGQDPELQLKDLRDYVQARGWEVFREYVDIGESGSKDRRPALDQLMNDARKRRLDVVVVWRLDRFGRSMKHLVNSLDELRALGVGFVSLKEALDFTTPTGRLMFHLLSAFSEFERDLIRERVRAGIQNAKAKGKHIGRRSFLSPELLYTVTDMRDRGLTIRAIARQINASPGLVHKILKNSRSQTIENQGIEIKESGVY
ncbi:MAG: recombinase family protein [Candidatus Methanomethylicaceae archaeon]